MRPLLPGDLSSAARALLAASAKERAALLWRILNEADAADHHFRRTGTLHPLWGTGTVMTSARRFPLADEPFVDDPEYLECLLAVLSGLRMLRRRGSRSRRN